MVEAEMNLFEKMLEEVLAEELLNEVKIDMLIKIVKSPELIRRSLDMIGKKDPNAGLKVVSDNLGVKMSRPAVDAALKAAGVYINTTAVLNLESRLHSLR